MFANQIDVGCHSSMTLFGDVFTDCVASGTPAHAVRFHFSVLPKQAAMGDGTIDGATPNGFSIAEVSGLSGIPRARE